jgi:hypothetical protein
MPGAARIGRIARWVIFVFFGWQTVASAGAAIYWGAEGHSSDALLASFVAIVLRADRVVARLPDQAATDTATSMTSRLETQAP